MRNSVHKPNEETAVIREYADIAPQYDRRWASYITATLRETQKRLDIKPTDRLLDIGCGTGSLLQAISQKHPSVNLIGLDISKEMLKVACNKQKCLCTLLLRPSFPTTGCAYGWLLNTTSCGYRSQVHKHNKQIYRCTLFSGQSQFLPFHSSSFDIVVSCNTFHYWRNPEVCLREIARVLKPQGRLVITDWCDDYIACKICDLFLRMFNRAHFKTYRKDACERLLRDTGYGNVRVERYRIDWLWGMMTAKAQAHPAC